MHPADIKAALEKRGLSQAAIAMRSKRGADRHVGRSAVCRVINGTLKSGAIARCIAEAIELPIATVFPGRYPELEFIEASGLRRVSARQAETELRSTAAPKKPARRKVAA